MHNYTLYIIIWFAVSVFTLFWFRFMAKKMKQTDYRDTKNSLFTIMIIIGIPALLGTVLFPLIFIIADKNMGTHYRISWSFLILAFAIYFIIKQKTSKKEKNQPYSK